MLLDLFVRHFSHVSRIRSPIIPILSGFYVRSVISFLTRAFFDIFAHCCSSRLPVTLLTSTLPVCFDLPFSFFLFSLSLSLSIHESRCAAVDFHLVERDRNWSTRYKRVYRRSGHFGRADSKRVNYKEPSIKIRYVVHRCY